MGSSRIHEAIAAITHGTLTDIADSVAGISRIGHTSGWDAMAGVLLTLDAWLASRTR